MATDRDDETPPGLEGIQQLGPVLIDSYFVVDEERRIVAFNNALVDLLGLRPAERRNVVGTHCYDLLKLEICKDRCIALEALKKNSPVRMEEIHGNTSRGRELVLTLSAMPLRQPNGELAGVVVTQRDVTDERRLKTRLEAETADHQQEREALLKILRDKEAEVAALKRKGK